MIIEEARTGHFEYTYVLRYFFFSVSRVIAPRSRSEKAAGKQLA